MLKDGCFLGVSLLSQLVEAYMHVQTLSCLAAALAQAGQLPAKLNLIIPNLMVSLRKDGTGELQQVAAAGLAELVVCCISREPGPNPKVRGCTVLWGRGDRVGVYKEAEPEIGDQSVCEGVGREGDTVLCIWATVTMSCAGGRLEMWFKLQGCLNYCWRMSSTYILTCWLKHHCCTLCAAGHQEPCVQRLW
jgi:hypothetical protein